MTKSNNSSLKPLAKETIHTGRVKKPTNTARTTSKYDPASNVEADRLLEKIAKMEEKAEEKEEEEKERKKQDKEAKKKLEIMKKAWEAKAKKVMAAAAKNMDKYA